MHYKLLRRLGSGLMMCLLCVMTFAQTTVSGVVKDSQGYPVPGAAVMIVGTTTGTATDFDGLFSLDGVSSDASLQISYLGFATQTIAVNGKTSFEVILEDDSQNLQEVVAVGYGQMKKSDVTGSIASVSTEQLVAKGATSVLENLQGAVPGVSITQSSGRTNGGFDIEIRGKSSLNSSTTPIYVIDGVVCGDMDFLNPQDIERLDVLKDASSTAIYGSRASAGVIMITTKSGAGVSKKKEDQCAQKFNVAYDGYYGTSKVARKADFMSADEFYQYRFFRFLQFGTTGVAQPTTQLVGSAFSQGMLENVDKESVLKRMLKEGDTYDWVDLVTQKGQKQNHFLSFSGATSDISYRIGAGVTKEKGIYKGDEMTRYNFKGSVDSDCNQYLSAGFSVNAAVTENSYANDEAVSEAMRMNPFIRPYKEDGSLLQYPGQKEALGTEGTDNQFTSSINPLCYMDNQTMERETYRLLGNAYLEIKPLIGLSLKTTFAPSFTYYRQGQFDDTQYDIATDNRAQIQAKKSVGYTWTNVLSYNRIFSSVHNVSLMAMHEISGNKSETSKYDASQVLEGSLWYNPQSGNYDVAKTTFSYSENSMLSLAFRANYSYAGKYMVTGTVRGDASSKFEKDHKWAFFPSAALAWRVSEENFMADILDVLSNLKLRLSYGVSGNNTGVSDYETQQTVGGPVYNTVGTQQVKTFYPSGIVDKEISWESSKEYNVGIDFGFLNNRISGTFDVYQKNSYDLLYDVDLPLEAGGVSMMTNVGEVRNRGLEIAVTGVIFENEDWNWEMSATFATNKNKVIDINGTGNDLVSKRLFIGHPINNVYTHDIDGIVTDKDITVPDTQIARDKGFTPGQTVKSADYYFACYGWNEGMPIFHDIEGDGNVSEDYTIKSSDPKWTGSISTTVSYKGIDLSASLYTKQGYHVSSQLYNRYIDYSDRGRNRLAMDFYIPAGTLLDCDGVSGDGTYINPVYQQQTHYGKAPFPNFSASGSGSGEYWQDAASVVDASFVKIKNITLGYSIPKNILDAVHLQKARLYCTVTNPFCWAKDDFKGWDPEWAGASLKNDGPGTVTWEFGLNLKF